MIKFTFKIFLLLVSIFTPIFALAENEDNNEVGDLTHIAAVFDEKLKDS